jgi:hypothetical protein
VILISKTVTLLATVVVRVMDGWQHGHGRLDENGHDHVRLGENGHDRGRLGENGHGLGDGRSRSRHGIILRREVGMVFSESENLDLSLLVLSLIESLLLTYQ